MPRQTNYRQDRWQHTYDKLAGIEAYKNGELWSGTWSRHKQLGWQMAQEHVETSCTCYTDAHTCPACRQAAAYAERNELHYMEAF